MKRVGQILRESLVNRVKDNINKYPNLFLISYSQVSAATIDDLRKSLAKAGAKVYVSKNSIAEIALKDLKHDKLAEKLTGQTAFIWGDKEATDVAKILVKFTKDSDNIKIQGGLLQGLILRPAEVQQLADLPSKDALRAQLLGVLQAPVSRLLAAMNAKTRDLLSVLKQYSEKKGGS